MSKRIKGQTNVTKKLIGRSNFLLVCMVMLFVLVSVNLFRIQILNYEKYKAEATQVQLRETQLSAKRGTVYDSNMKVLAQSVTVWKAIMMRNSPARWAGLSLLKTDWATIWAPIMKFWRRQKTVTVL